MNKPKVLGKGLNALLASRPAAVTVTAPPVPQPDPSVAESVTHIGIEQIQPNPAQPRRLFRPEALQELSQSIRANGIIQPLVVRKYGNNLQLVAGERRLRAARLAGLSEVPVVIQDIPDDRLLEITLIENLQREDLNPIEAAQAFERLAQELNLSPEQIGERTGKDRSTIVNSMRLLQLPSDVQDMVADGRLTAGHARSLLSLPTAALRREIAEKAIQQGWSVREIERVTRRMTEIQQPKQTEEAEKVDPNVKAAIVELERVLGTKVRIVEKARQKGRIEIEYYSSEDLDRIYTLIVGESS
jgi:ParB family transcriptional regulator, chromosome partitioning protein